jgi:hypothetical protein
MLDKTGAMADPWCIPIFFSDSSPDISSNNAVQAFMRINSRTSSSTITLASFLFRISQSILSNKCEISVLHSQEKGSSTKEKAKE